MVLPAIPGALADAQAPPLPNLGNECPPGSDGASGHLSRAHHPSGAADRYAAAPDSLGSPHRAARAWAALRICSFTASRLKLAPFCMGGNCTNVSPTF